MRAGSLGLLEPTSGVLESLSAPTFLRLSTIPDGLKVLFREPAITVEVLPIDLSGVEIELLVKIAPFRPDFLFSSCFGSVLPPRFSLGSLLLTKTLLTALWSCCCFGVNAAWLLPGPV